MRNPAHRRYSKRTQISSLRFAELVCLLVVRRKKVGSPEELAMATGFSRSRTRKIWPFVEFAKSDDLDLHVEQHFISVLTGQVKGEEGMASEPVALLMLEDVVLRGAMSAEGFSADLKRQSRIHMMYARAQIAAAPTPSLIQRLDLVSTYLDTVNSPQCLGASKDTEDAMVIAGADPEHPGEDEMAGFGGADDGACYDKLISLVSRQRILTSVPRIGHLGQSCIMQQAETRALCWAYLGGRTAEAIESLETVTTDNSRPEDIHSLGTYLRNNGKLGGSEQHILNDGKGCLLLESLTWQENGIVLFREASESQIRQGIIFLK